MLIVKGYVSLYLIKGELVCYFDDQKDLSENEIAIYKFKLTIEPSKALIFEIEFLEYGAALLDDNSETIAQNQTYNNVIKKYIVDQIINLGATLKL